MALYEYLCIDLKCPRGRERFVLRRSIANRNVVATCPNCANAALRCVVPSSPASFRIGGGK